jgi:hypothetical protein
MMSVAARSPVQCPAGSRVSLASPSGALVSCPDSHWSSRPSARPVQPATVAAESSGDSGVPDGGEHGHVVPLDRAAERLLQRVQVGDVDVIDVDAFLGQQRRQLLQQLVRHAGLELDLRRSGGWLGGTAAHVWHADHHPSSGPLAVR